jgi:hypothetical protein
MPDPATNTYQQCVFSDETPAGFFHSGTRFPYLPYRKAALKLFQNAMPVVLHQCGASVSLSQHP